MAADGPGNFENDSAADVVAGIVAGLEKELEPVAEIEFVDYFMGALAIQLTLVKHCNAVPPKRERLETMRSQILSLYDREIDGLHPKPEYKRDRRNVIVETFSEFIALGQA